MEELQVINKKMSMQSYTGNFFANSLTSEENSVIIK